jgi:hypothetical protein
MSWSGQFISADPWAQLPQSASRRLWWNAATHALALPPHAAPQGAQAQATSVSRTCLGAPQTFTYASNPLNALEQVARQLLQVPPLQVLPQHSPPAAQGAPVVLQVPLLQTLFLQVPPQQSPADVHAEPSPLQTPPHRPLGQLPLQHSLPAPQSEP